MGTTAVRAGGGLRGPVVRRWHAIRLVASGVGGGLGLVVALIERDPLIGMAAAVGIVPAVDSARYLVAGAGSVDRSIVIDIVVAAAAAAVIRPGWPSLVLAIVYYVALISALRPPSDARRLVPLGAAMLAMVVAARVLFPRTEPLVIGDVILTAGFGVLALLAVVYLGAAVERLAAADAAALAALDERLRFEHAIALCSRALLRNDDVGIRQAMEALLEATGAHQVFVDLTIEHPELGTCARLAHEVLAAGYEDRSTADIYVDPATGEPLIGIIPYSALPPEMEDLWRGLPVVITTETIDGAGRELYGAHNMATELNLPILVDGAWFGCLGFGHFDEPFEWDTTQIEFLRTAADMFGAFYERTMDRERLLDLVDAKDELIASVSHELRTPLSVIMGLGVELRDRGDEFSPEERDHLIELIATQSEEMSDLIEDLLTAAASERGDVSLVPELVPVGSVLDELLARAIVKERSLTVDDDGAKAWVDPVRLRQILRNLLTNACRYGGPHIEVRIRAEGERTIVEVIDDGEGIPEGLTDEAFRAFGRAHHRSTQTQSVGLGLAVSMRLAESMEGSLRYLRRDGRTVFRVALPAHS